MQWLSPPDPFSNHDAAVDKRRRDTGQWLLESAQLVEWRESEDSFLWLYGFAGCGKTILASTAIENTRNHCQSRPDCAIAVFYFDFNDVAKQKSTRCCAHLFVSFIRKPPLRYQLLTFSTNDVLGSISLEYKTFLEFSENLSAISVTRSLF
jgi:hypothetical protein